MKMSVSKNSFLAVVVSMLGVFCLMVAISCAPKGGVKRPVAGERGYYYISGSGGATSGPLKVDRVELNFQNDRGEITVSVNEKLKAYAVIRFSGNGLFRAFWVVDGRVVEEVTLTLAFGNTLTLWTRPETVLPTFEPGPHTLTLKIEQPKPAFKVPAIRYFVAGIKR